MSTVGSMATGYAMIDRPNPNYTQGQAVRRGGNVPVGLAVIHTFEIAPDIIPPDLSAESGLAYLRSRSTPGCYHRLSDADSRLPLYPFSWETWHCAPTNKWSNGFCMATQAHLWAQLPAAHRENLLRNCARDVAAFIAWMKDERGVVVPIRWIDRDAALAKQPGLTMHRITDPTRRSDPGFLPASTTGRLFLEMVGDYSRTPGEIPISRDHLRPGLLLDGDFGEYTIKALQQALRGVGEDVGPIDGDFGCMSITAEQRWLHSHRLYNELPFDCARDGYVVYALQQALNLGRIS